MEIEKKVKEVFFDVFFQLNDKTFDWNAKQEDYSNWDSFAHARGRTTGILVSTQEEFVNVVFHYGLDSTGNVGTYRTL